MGSLITHQRTILVASSASGEAPLVLQELPAKPLGPRDVRVKLHSIGVNPVDWKMRSGGPLRFAHRFLGPRGPLVVGVDFAGEVVECGAQADLKLASRVVGATDFSRGQRGSYASEVVVRDEQCAVLPDSVGFDDAACLPVPGATALRCFAEAGLPTVGKAPSARILVLGASGGVGLITLQLARAMGATAVGVCSSRNRALVERLGAIAIDYTAGDALTAAREHGPFDLVLQGVGSDVYPLARCRALLKDKGLVALIVVNPSDVPSMLFRRSVKSVLGRPNRSMLEPLVAAFARGEIETLVEDRFALADAEQAHQRSKAGKVVGKLLLIP